MFFILFHKRICDNHFEHTFRGIYMSINKKWELTVFTNAKYYGEKGNKAFGLQAWPNKDYYLGQWKNECVEGLGMYRYKDGHAYLGEHISIETEGRGVFLFENQVVINLRITGTGDDIIYHRFIIWTDSGAWKFFTVDKNNNQVNIAFEYHVEGGELLFVGDDEEDEDNVTYLKRPFETTRPIVQRILPAFKALPDLETYEQERISTQTGTNKDGKGYSIVNFYPDSSKKQYISFSEWSDGDFYIGERVSGDVAGWGLCRHPKRFDVAYYAKKHFERNGLVVDFWDSGNVAVALEKSDKSSSFKLFFDSSNNRAAYANTNSEGRCEGPGIVIDLNEEVVYFVTYHDGSFDDYEYSIYADGTTDGYWEDEDNLEGFEGDSDEEDEEDDDDFDEEEEEEEDDEIDIEIGEDEEDEEDDDDDDDGDTDEEEEELDWASDDNKFIFTL